MLDFLTRKTHLKKYWPGALIANGVAAAPFPSVSGTVAQRTSSGFFPSSERRGKVAHGLAVSEDRRLIA
jgi:hypothetical protein